MKVAVVGSRQLTVSDLGQYLPPETTEIVSGGAKGIDMCAADFAESRGLIVTEFVPQYARYGRAAPLVRNYQIIAYADRAVVFWDGVSRGTKYTIDLCHQMGKPVTVYRDCDGVFIKQNR